jgi:hypothetical protein
MCCLLGSDESRWFLDQRGWLDRKSQAVDRGGSEAQMSEERKLKIDPGYIVSEIGPNQFKVYKLDFSPSPDGYINVEKAYSVIQGVCDCEGFKHRLRCRHVDLIRNRPKTVSRLEARVAAVEIMESWEWRFDRIVFDEFVFEEDSDDIREVKLKAWGKPIIFDGRNHNKLTGVAKNGAFVILDVIS